MTKPQKVFRYLWRVNAVLILVAAGAATFGVGLLVVSSLLDRAARRRQSEAAVAVAQPDPRMSLTQAAVVAGTHVMRAHLILYRNSSGYSSSSGYGETRNVLFIEPGEKTARWLLGDNRHVLSESFDLSEDADSADKRTVATAALVKPATDDTDFAKGRLLLFDPSGHRVVEAASGVRKIQVASLKSGDISLLYERDRHLVLATFDAGSLVKRSEQEMDIPPLK